jgi:spore maturation protein CgeB
VRILVAHPGPQFSVQDVYAGWVEALTELGQDVGEYNLGERLTFYEQARFERAPGVFSRALPDNESLVRFAVNGLYADLYRFRPHVLLCVSGFFIPGRLLDAARSYGTRVVVLHTESPYQEDQQLQLAEHADLNVLNDPTNLSRYPSGTVYLPHAYRPTVHHPGPAEPDMVCDFAFVGTGYASRVHFLEAMDLSGLDVVLAGNWQSLEEQSPLRAHVGHDLEDCFDNEQTARLYRSARVGMNLYRREAERPELSTGWSMGPREVEAAACGHFFLRDPRGEGDEVLPMLPTFTSPEEASDQLRYWLAHDDEREALASKAREAIADRTFDNHAAQLLRLLDKE